LISGDDLERHIGLSTSEKRLIGCFYGSVTPRVDMPRLLQWYDEGKLKLDELITQTYRLGQINEAFADMEAGRNARGVIVFDKGDCQPLG
jgi:S-(hydroxymethyl)glutathione dehydrogenase/alcohol dehydrogenase